MSEEEKKDEGNGKAWSGGKNFIFVMLAALSVTSFIFINFSSCSTVGGVITESIKTQEEKDWEAAQEENTLEGYKEFLDKYPDSRYKNELIRRANRLIRQQEREEWEEVKKKDTLEDYKKFIEKYSPHGYYIDYAKEAIRNLEIDDWRVAESENTIEAYEKFLEKWAPDGEYVNDAKEAIVKIEDEKKQAVIEKEYLEIRESGDIAKLQAFIEKYPDSDYVDCAKLLIDLNKAKEKLEENVGKSIVIEDNTDKFSNPYAFNSKVAYVVSRLSIYQWISQEEALVTMHNYFNGFTGYKSEVFHIRFKKVDPADIEDPNNILSVVLNYTGDYKYESLSGIRVVPSFNLLAIGSDVWGFYEDTATEGCYK